MSPYELEITMTPNDRVTLAQTLQQIEQRSNIRFVFVTTSPTQYSRVALARTATNQVRAAFVKLPNRYGTEPAQAPPLAIPLPGMRALLTAADLKDTMTLSARLMSEPGFTSQVAAAMPFASAYVDTRVSEVLVNHLGMETMAIEAVAASATARRAITQSLLDAAAEAATTLPGFTRAQPVTYSGAQPRIGAPLDVVQNIEARAIARAQVQEPPLMQVERANYSFALASMSAALAILRTNNLPAVVDLDIPVDMRRGTMTSIDDLLNPDTPVSRADITESINSLMTAINEAALAQGNLPAEAGQDQGRARVNEIVRRIVDETVANATGMSGSGYAATYFADRAITYTGQPYEYRILAPGPQELSIDAGAQLEMGPPKEETQELEDWATNQLTHLGN